MSRYNITGIDATFDPAVVASNLQRWGYMDPGEDVDNMGPRSRQFIRSVAKWQDTYAYMLDDGCHRFHGRRLVADGDVGPASLELLNTPRCGCRDPQPGDATSEANIPKACRSTIKLFWFLKSLNISEDRSSEEMKAACKSWAKVIDLNWLFVGSQSEALIWAGAGALPVSNLAWSYLAQNSCSSKLEQRYNTRVDWTRSQYLQRVAAHELGHALGMQHINNRSALLNPYITDIIVPQPLDIAAMIRLGYEAAKDDPTPPPPPPPGPGGDVWDKVKEIRIHDEDGNMLVKYRAGRVVM